MANIAPFRALRFTAAAGDIDELCCPPYDIISDEQRRAFLGTNEKNIIRLELPREGENPYAVAGDTLKAWLESGALKQDDAPALYVYQEEFVAYGKPYTLRGFTCTVELQPFSAGVVLPHEETLSKAKQDRFDLMCATGCNFSQIYSLYDDPDRAVDAILDKFCASEPAARFTDADDVIHSLWVVPDGDDVRAVCKLFEDKKLYIADGHHRYETALRYRDHLRAEGGETGSSDRVMMFLCAMQHDGLVVFPTHRVIHNIDGFDSMNFLKEAAAVCDVLPLAKFEDIEPRLAAVYAEGGKAFGYYDGEKAALIKVSDLDQMKALLPNASKSLRELDVTLLHSLLLERLCGIDKAAMAAGGKLTYTRDAAEAKALTDSGADACFILNPTRVTEISAVAREGEKMPQKSTYFYPKLITGLTMNKLL